jgi:hypothetical protein
MRIKQDITTYNTSIYLAPNTKYVHIKSTTVYAPRRNWDSPQPPTRRLVCPLPPVSGGRGTHAGKKGVGRVPIPTRGIHCGTLYMYVLCGAESSERERRHGPNKKKIRTASLLHCLIRISFCQSNRLLILLLQAEKEMRFLIKNCMLKLYVNLDRHSPKPLFYDF